jgi:hypothetical protein
MKVFPPLMLGKVHFSGLAVIFRFLSATEEYAMERVAVC